MMDVKPYETAHGVLAPTLVIHGSEDEVIPVDYAHRLVKELPAGESCIIPLGDHCFDLLHEPMADAAVSFLNWL
jgi:pimeloyl-ACP methyl ester carboxylesterase